MKVRTEGRRQHILKVAMDVFREVGFERATMTLITERVGGSKATLYGYFPSKEELFVAAMIEATTLKEGERALSILDPAEPDFISVLERFSQAFVRLVSSRDSLAMSRTVIAEATNQKLGEAFYAQGPKRILNAIADYMAHLAERGAIQARDPRLAAIHFHALLEAGIVPLLMGARPELKPKDAAIAAVDVFVRAYGAEFNNDRRQTTISAG